MAAPLRFYSLWAINDVLEPARLGRQLDEMRALGLDGVVFHPRNYPDDPAYLGASYLRILSDVILYARDRGLRFWLYDENGWPSGIAGGRVLERYPELGAVHLASCKAPEGEVLAEVAEMETPFLCVRNGHGVDYFNPEACRRFLEITHATYAAGLHPEAWQHVEAVFTDEPELGLAGANIGPDTSGSCLPWSPVFPDAYRERTGRDLIRDLPLLFRAEDGGDARVRFWEMAADQLAEGFHRPYSDWCAAHGKLFTGHNKGEEHPYFQIPMCGPLHRTLRHMQMPGLDALERRPGNDFYPAQIAGIARQCGSDRVFCEAFGGSGWGAAPEDFLRYMRWLIGHGVTDIALHLWQYRLKTSSIRDWPPSQPNHLNWKAALPELIEQLKSEQTERPQRTADGLIVVPYRRLMREFHPAELKTTNIHNASVYPKTEAGRLNERILRRVEEANRVGEVLDWVDEATFEELGEPAGQGVRIGGAEYAAAFGFPENELTEAALARIHVTEGPGAGPESRSATRRLPAREEFPLRWTWAETPLNALPLPVEADGGRCAVQLPPFLDEGKGCDRCHSWRLRFSDPVRELRCEGVLGNPEPSEEPFGHVLPLEAVPAGFRLTFRNTGERPPFVWLEGDFLLRSQSEWTSDANGTEATAGPFALVPAGPREGLPVGPWTDFAFARGPFSFTAPVGAIASAEDAPLRLRFSGLRCDALRLHTETGGDIWVFGPDFEGTLPAIGSGMRTLRVDVFPSTYNYFGPHGYIRGDAPVISPAQYEGLRNFADADLERIETIDGLWRAKPWSPPTAFSLLSEYEGSGTV